MPTKIQWADETWNPITGCSKISDGCKNCYAERMAKRLAGRFGYPADEPFRPTLHPDRLNDPRKWKKHRRVFVCSMSDLFHEEVPNEWRIKVFNAMATDIFLPCKHTYLILTKRPENMKRFFDLNTKVGDPVPWPNVWLGVTAENQEQYDKRIPLLLQIPAAVRFVSIEPMLGPIDVKKWLFHDDCDHYDCDGDCPVGLNPPFAGIDWVICGGESGPGARPVHPDWVRSLRDQCQAAGVPFFFKQWGEWITKDKSRPNDEIWPSFKKSHCWNPKLSGMYKRDWAYCVGKKAAGRLLDGREWSEYPK